MNLANPRVSRQPTKVVNRSTASQELGDRLSSAKGRVRSRGPTAGIYHIYHVYHMYPLPSDFVFGFAIISDYAVRLSVTIILKKFTNTYSF